MEFRHSGHWPGSGCEGIRRAVGQPEREVGRQSHHPQRAEKPLHCQCDAGLATGRSDGRRPGDPGPSRIVKGFLFNSRGVLLLLLLLAALGLTACATTGDDSENASVRPWNSPKGWENGLPSNMTEGR